MVAPGNAAPSVLLGVSLTALPISGFCAPLGTAPLVALPLGTTDVAGALALGSTVLP